MKGCQPKGLQQYLFCGPQFLYVGPGKWGDGITPFSLRMSIYTFHSSTGFTIQRKEYYFPFFKTPQKREELLKVNSLRRMGKVEHKGYTLFPPLISTRDFLVKPRFLARNHKLENCHVVSPDLINSVCS